jgi:sodium transport system ATP-binding protein
VVVISHGRVVADGTVAELSERTGEADFEEAFVALAFSNAERLEAGEHLASETPA